jgi:hypothetical protein
LHQRQRSDKQAGGQKSHGCELFGTQPYQQMVRRGISPEAVIDELLVMEIEWLKRVAEGSP